LSLALEYQGQTHYYSTHIFGQASNRQRADNIKREFAAKLGITLISIPFWWDKSLTSLAATIYSHRPDLSLDGLTSGVVPVKMPNKLQNKFYYVPNVPTNYKEDKDPTGWYVARNYRLNRKVDDGDV
jgi:hypothetical protein